MLNFADDRTGVAPSPIELSFNLDVDATAELRRISAETGVSPESLLQVALRFLFIAADARGKQRRMLVTSPFGRPLQELIIPIAQPGSDA